MQKKLRILLLLFLSINVASAQDTLLVSRLLISENADDYSPFVWENNLVFTSDRPSNSIGIEYRDSKTDSRSTGLYSAQIINDTTFLTPKTLSKKLISVHNDGPASFTRDGKYIYYSRPINNENTSEARKDHENYAIIYQAEWDGIDWVNHKAMPFCDANYVNTHPAISPDGSFIVFASSIEGGKGASDLVISRKVSGVWSDPVHLKGKVNSKSRDSFPYIHSNGDLYFSSDRKGDLDIYKCKAEGDSWSKPEALPSPINSKFDENTFYMDNKGSKGYFSSNRDGYFDLYYFHGPEVDEWQCDSLIEESFCYTFPRIKSDELEGMPLKFEWMINGESPIPADQLVYCFPEAGRYTVKLNIVDTVYDQVIFVKEIYEFMVERVQQPYINVADFVEINTSVDFDASESFLPNIEAIEHDWDFGDGEGLKGIQVQHIYSNTGRFKVSLTVFGSPNGGIIPHYCSYKYINVSDESDEDILAEMSSVIQPLDLMAFVKMIEYEALPNDLYYLNLIGTSDNVMLINLFNSEEKIELTNEIFSGIKDTTKLHTFENDNNTYSYYFGATFNIKDAYGHLVEAREAGFSDAVIKNFKYTKLQSDEYFLSPIEEISDQFAVVLRKTDQPIPNFKKEFKKVPESLGEVSEIYVEGEGYYYVMGSNEDLNEAFSSYSELKHNGFKSIRVKEFKEKNAFSGFTSISSSKEGNSYMIELFKSPDYLIESDSVFDLLGDRKVVSIRLDKRNVAYFVEGGPNLLEAKATLKAMKELGFEEALISNFTYEKLSEDGYYISSMVESDFTYVINFDSSEVPLSMDDPKYKSLIGHKVYEHYDPVRKKFYYQVDVGKNLPGAVLLAKELMNDSMHFQQIDRLRYEPLNDDEFYIDKLTAGDDQFVLVLGSFKEKQNVYQTFKGFSSCNEIREFYDEVNKEYIYLAGGYEDLEDIFIALQECKEMGMEDVYIQKFVYSPLEPDQFYLEPANEEEEVFRITLSRTGEEENRVKSTDESYDDIRDEGDMIDAYDSETDEFVVAISSAKSLPIVLDNLENAFEKGYNSLKVQRFIYSSMDKDRFVIRDINKEDRYFCVELFHTDSLIPTENPLLREISRKYPIKYSYNEPTKDFVYVVGPLVNKEGAEEYLAIVKADGFTDSKIMTMVFQTLKQDEFYLEEIEEQITEFVITLLKTKNKVDVDDPYFDNLPDGLELVILDDKNSGYYNYIIKNLENIDIAGSLYARIKNVGYPNALLERLKYEPLNPDEFTLEAISESSDDFTISLLRSKEKLGIEHSMFDEIREAYDVFEFYNYQTKEYIYTMDKANGMVAAFDMLLLAKANNFDNAKIDHFVYSALNPDHFTLEELSFEHTLFTIVIADSKTQLDASYFDEIEKAGYQVREKHIPGMDKWVYSIGLTNNIAEAKMIAENAKLVGFSNAKVLQFNYMPLNPDNYYLTEIEDDEVAYMLELYSANERIDIDGEHFENVNDIYNVSEVYDPVDKKYKYYAGEPILDEEEAGTFRDELIAMGYGGTRISKFTYTAFNIDEYYLDKMDDLDDVPFDIDEDAEHEISVYFGFDQYELTSTDINNINSFYTDYYNREFELIVTGHTDSSGDPDYNMQLSLKRSQSVKKYLLSLGVDKSKISIVAKGETELLYTGSDNEEQSKNRRVIIRSKKSGIPHAKKDKNEYEFFVLFGFDQYFLTNSAVNSLKSFYNSHFNREYQIIVIGHTDSSGDANYNMWLSQQRAKSVKKYLLSMGVDESKISIIAKGEEHIIYNDQNKEDYSKSRRVMVRSTKPKK